MNQIWIKSKFKETLTLLTTASIEIYGNRYNFIVNNHVMGTYSRERCFEIMEEIEREMMLGETHIYYMPQE